MKSDRRDHARIEVCPDCDGLGRRDFLRRVGLTAAAAGAAALPLRDLGASPASLLSGAAEKKPAETFVKDLYETLTPEQKKVMVFPFDHELRSYIANNWDVVEPDVGAIGKLYTSDQQELIREILKGVTSEEGYEKFQKQMKDDAGGFERYTCAIFGKPGEEKFEFVLTGRHLTIRADGNSVENAAFGGPIFYGHAVTFNEKPDHPGNVWWHQARLANEVYQSLDGKQQEKALHEKSPEDNADTVRLRGSSGKFRGIAVGELSGDQKQLFKKTMKSMLSMYRESDVDEAIACVEKNGGIDALHMSFYKERDLGKDGIWDRWSVMGPTFVWYFRGSPHVHTWLHVGDRAPGEAKKVRL